MTSERAYRHFIAAHDSDGFPVRCLTAFQDVYREIASRHDVILIDGQAELHAIGRHGQLDDHLFQDAMHPSLRGQIAIAQAILRELRARRAFGWPESAPAPVIDPAQCAARFRLTREAWKKICLWGVHFGAYSPWLRYDPARRLDKKRIYAEAYDRLDAGEPIEALGLPNLGLPEPVPAVIARDPSPANRSHPTVSRERPGPDTTAPLPDMVAGAAGVGGTGRSPRGRPRRSRGPDAAGDPAGRGEHRPGDRRSVRRGGVRARQRPGRFGRRQPGRPLGLFARARRGGGPGAGAARAGTHDLSAAGIPAMELVCGAQPCCQCYGMVWWSGVRGLVIGARGEDVESIAGFREGPLPPDWAGLLQRRSDLPPVEVERDVLRDEALAPLQGFRDSGRPAYNPGARG